MVDYWRGHWDRKYQKVEWGEEITALPHLGQNKIIHASNAIWFSWVLPIQAIHRGQGRLWLLPSAGNLAVVPYWSRGRQLKIHIGQQSMCNLICSKNSHGFHFTTNPQTLRSDGWIRQGSAVLMQNYCIFTPSLYINMAQTIVLLGSCSLLVFACLQTPEQYQ